MSEVPLYNPVTSGVKRRPDAPNAPKAPGLTKPVRPHQTDRELPHGGLRTIHQKSTFPGKINFQDFSGHVTPRFWLQ